MELFLLKQALWALFVDTGTIEDDIIIIIKDWQTNDKLINDKS